MKAFIYLAVAPKRVNIGFSLHFPSLWQKAARSFGSPNPSILKAAILFSLLDCLLSVPLFTAWTSTRDGFMKVLFGDRPDECSVTQPVGGSCSVNICHVPPFWGYKHLLVCLFPALHTILLYNLSQGSRTKGPSGSRADCCHSLPTNPSILFYIRVSLWRPNVYPCHSNLTCLPLLFCFPCQE